MECIVGRLKTSEVAREVMFLVFHDLPNVNVVEYVPSYFAEKWRVFFVL